MKNQLTIPQEEYDKAVGTLTAAINTALSTHGKDSPQHTKAVAHLANLKRLYGSARIIKTVKAAPVVTHTRTAADITATPATEDKDDTNE